MFFKLTWRDEIIVPYVTVIKSRQPRTYNTPVFGMSIHGLLNPSIVKGKFITGINTMVRDEIKTTTTRTGRITKELGNRECISGCLSKSNPVALRYKNPQRKNLFL